MKLRKTHTIPGINCLSGTVLLHAGLCSRLTEADVDGSCQSEKEAVTGNVFISSCIAIAFLKVSQKSDSFLASLQHQCRQYRRKHDG